LRGNALASYRMASKILVVEDDPSMRFMLRLIFERAGHEVLEAEHGAVALERIKESRPDAVVTDLMMPVMDGLVLIRLLRSQLDTSTIPIIVVSANPDGAEAARAADAAVPKPFLPADLVQTVDSLLKAEGARGTA